MKDVSQGQGRTVLFVSHNMASVKSLCHTGILLENGMMKEIGEIDPIVSHYLRGSSEVDNYHQFDKPLGKNGFELLEIGVRPQGGDYTDVMRVSDDIEIVMHYRLTMPMKKFWITLHMKNERGEKIFSTSGLSHYEGSRVSGEYEQRCLIPKDFLNWGNFVIDIMAFNQDKTTEQLIDESDVVSFTLANRPIELGGWMGREPGDVTPKFEYTEKRIG